MDVAANGDTTLVWLRLDLRLQDNPALAAAARRGPVIPVFIWAPDEEAPWEPGAASRWWLHESLRRLGTELAGHGSRLVLRRGPTAPALRELAVEAGATTVVWNRRYEPVVVARDAQVERELREGGLAAESFNGSLLAEPGEVLSAAGKPFRAFTPFWRACLEQLLPTDPAPAPALAAPTDWPGSIPLASLELEPRIDWAAGLRAAWCPGETGAQAAVRRFGDRSLAVYGEVRDRPDLEATSRLSPHLHFGEISPGQLWHAFAGRPGADVYLRQLGWREFAHHLLFHFPHTAEQPLRAEFATFPWADDPEALAAWRRGRTGFPLVDAGMRELWDTGFVHNRVRMVVASFLVKDLLLPWQEGARWFWDTLVDADLANNTLGWRWSAGCGADAAPYFRVFNPVLQGRKFDPNGAYVRRYLPELRERPPERIHEPYGDPIVDHAQARRQALQAFASMRRGASPRAAPAASFEEG
jgi:deoxyribodipyrimidine photo-lyase